MKSSARWLQDNSPAYNAYTELNHPPFNVPHFETDENGYPFVELGEIFCRMLHQTRKHCSSRLSCRTGLLVHLELVHGATKANRPPISLSTEVGARAQRFYIAIMVGQEYVGRREKATISRVFALSTSGRSAAVQLGSNDQSSTKPHDFDHTSNWLRPTGAAPGSSSIAGPERSTAPVSGEPIVSSSSRDHDQVTIKAEESLMVQRDQASSRITAPTPISIDSDDDLVPENIKVEYEQHKSVHTSIEEEGADEDLEMEIEADEIRLRIVRNKQKLAARRRKRQERM